MALNSVVLSSQKLDLNDALYNAQRGKEQARDEAANPLVQKGQKLIPRVTRVFNVDRPMYVYLQAYDWAEVANTAGSTAASAITPLFAYVSSCRDEKAAMETPPIAVTLQPATCLGVVPLSFEVGLGKSAPGQYQC